MLSVLIATHLLVASRRRHRPLLLLLISVRLQGREAGHAGGRAPPRVRRLPAMPQDGYGWEKLFTERMCRHFTEDFGLETRVARYHNVYGPHGSYDGGREKAPAAICRKVAIAALNGTREIEVWGDGKQSRSFTYIDDCIEGTHRLMRSAVGEPINVGSSELVTIDELVDMVEDIAGVKLRRVLQARRAPGGARSQLGQHPGQASARLGAHHLAGRGDGTHIPLDLRRDRPPGRYGLGVDPRDVGQSAVRRLAGGLLPRPFDRRWL